MTTAPPPVVDEAPPTMAKGEKLIVTSCFPAEACGVPPQVVEGFWVFPVVGAVLALGWVAARLGLRKVRRAR